MPETVRAMFSNINTYYWEDENVFDILQYAFDNKVITKYDYDSALSCIAQMSLIADTYNWLVDENASIRLMQKGALQTAINVVKSVKVFATAWYDTATIADILVSQTSLWFEALHSLLQHKDRKALLDSNQLFIKFAGIESELREIYNTAKNI